jgi:hypothetical protein
VRKKLAEETKMTGEKWRGGWEHERQKLRR